MIEASHLSKSFGKTKAVSDIGFKVAEGEVFGLLGPNGAGKTTTLRILATLLKADSGTATINGLDVVKDAEQVRRIIGVVNGGMGLYDRLTGREVLHYFGRLYGMKRDAINARIKLLDELLDLRDTLDRRTADFSTGMKQKIVVARAVLHDPPVIFFDEATAGLDVMARRAVMNFVKRYPAENRIVIYSTHVMSEVEELCDVAAIIYRGKLIARDTIPGLVTLGHADTLEQAFFNIVSDSNPAAKPLEVA
jgi:sodium transport system ATP-binding protein